jgi:hypothetical protein
LKKNPEKVEEAMRKKREYEEETKRAPSSNVAAFMQGKVGYGRGTCPTVEIKICGQWTTRVYIDTGASGTALIINPTLIQLPPRIEIVKTKDMHLNIADTDMKSSVIGTCTVPFEIEGELFMAPTVLCPKFPVPVLMAYEYAKHEVFDNWGSFDKVRVRGTDKWVKIEDRRMTDRDEMNALVAGITDTVNWITTQETIILPGISKPIRVVADIPKKQSCPVWRRAPELEMACRVWTDTVLTHEDIGDMVIIVSNTGRIQTIIQPGARIAISEATASTCNEQPEDVNAQMIKSHQQPTDTQSQVATDRS